MNNIKSLEEISKIEIEEKWEEAIFELEKRLEVFNLEKKTILRLMVLYWELIIEDGCIEHALNFDELVIKFKNLFKKTFNNFKEDPEYLWITGYMIQLYEIIYGDFGENYKHSIIDNKYFGKDLMKKAIELSPNKPFKYSKNNDGYLGKYFSGLTYEIHD